MRTLLWLSLVLIFAGCPGPENRPDGGGATGGGSATGSGGGVTGGSGGGVTGGGSGGGATGGSGGGGGSATGGSGGGAMGGGGGTAASTFDPAGAWQLVLLMYYREPVLTDGGMGRSLSAPPDSGMRVDVQHPVHFRADDAGGYGIELTLVDGGACCADGPHFQVDGGALLFPAQRYRFPPGVSIQATVGSSPISLVTPWTLDVLNYESRAATEVSGSVRFPVVNVETSENANPQPAAYEHVIVFTRQ